LSFFEDSYNHLFENNSYYLWAEYIGFFSRLIIDLFNPLEYNSDIIISDKTKKKFQDNIKNLRLNSTGFNIKKIESIRNEVKEQIKTNDTIINNFIIYNLPGIKDKTFNKLYIKNIIDERLVKCTEFLLSIWVKAGEDSLFDNSEDDTINEYFFLGQIYVKIRQLEHAERIYKEMFEKFLKHILLYYSLAKFYSDIGKEDLAADVLFAFFEKNKNSDDKYFIITEPKIEIKVSPLDSSKTVYYEKFGSILPIINDIKKTRQEWLEIESDKKMKYFIKSTSGQIIDKYALIFMLAYNLDRLKGRSILSKESKNVWKLLLDTRFDNIARNRLFYGGKKND
ncbi:MAG: hypothetical protein ABIB46_02230, partial [bacterium]